MYFLMQVAYELLSQSRKLIKRGAGEHLLGNREYYNG